MPNLSKILIVFCTVVLSGCYDTMQVVITKEEAMKADLVKDLKFAGYNLKEDGTFEGEPDIYTVVGAKRPHDYIVELNKMNGGKRTIRFKQLEETLYLMQVQVGNSRRHQLVLLEKEGKYFNILMPHPFNDQGIDTMASQKDFARQLGIKFDGQGYGPYHLSGDRKKIQRFMHSLSTLPTRVVYRFKPI